MKLVKIIFLQGTTCSKFQDHNKRPPVLCITNDEEYFIVNLLVGIINFPSRKRVTQANATNLMTDDATT